MGRDFWVYFAGQTLSQLGGSFTLFALPLLVYKLTHSATNLAITTVADFAPYLLFGLILGAIVDRADRRRLMLRTDVARGLVILVGHDDLVAANGRIMATGYVGQVLGPLVASVALLALPVLFAKRVLSTTDTGVSGLYAAGAAGVVLVSLAAARIRRRLSFKVTALGALVVSGLSTALMAVIGEYWAALVLWAAASGFGLLFNINTGALRQALVPPEMLGRVMTVATVLAWSAIPLGALAGAAIINATGTVSGVYVGAGLLTAAIAGGFAFSPIRLGDRLLAEVAAAAAAGTLGTPER